MSYTELKSELEKLLSEDLNNRYTLQEMRRNVFLTTETTKKTQSIIQEKDLEINNLLSNVTEKENDLRSKKSEIEKIQFILDEERNAFELSKQSFISEISELKSTVSELQNEQQSLLSLKEETSKLSIENSHFAAKIRELIFHIDEQNTVHEKLEKELSNLRDALKHSTSEKNQLAFDLSETSSKEETINALTEELESTKGRIILLQTQLDTASELVNSQNNTITQLEGNLKSIEEEFTFVVDKFVEEKQLLVTDNGNLIAEMGLLTVKNEELYSENVHLHTKVVELQQQIDQFSDSLSELRSKEQMILSLNEEKERLNAIISNFSSEAKVDETAFVSQIEALKQEVSILTTRLDEINQASKTTIDALEFDKNNLILQIEDLEKQLISRSETISENTDSVDDAFIDKLFQQINLLNDEKLLLQTENEEAHSSITDLQAKCSELTQVIENQKNAIENLEETNKQTKLAETFLGLGSDKTSLKLKINELVREIDKCIALLSI